MKGTEKKQREVISKNYFRYTAIIVSKAHMGTLVVAHFFFPFFFLFQCIYNLHELKK